MKIDVSKVYPIKVWVTSLLLASLIFSIGTIINAGFSNFDFGIIGFMTFMFLYSFLFSSPLFMVYFLLSQTLIFNSVTMAKVSLSLIAVCGMAITFFLLFGKESYNFNGSYSAIAFTLIYALSIMIAGLYFTPDKS